ncbi:MAG: glycosyltransferase [Okeania sp. SIO3B3]|nr:glycosyltransferase [Okeania sp. SIO3B3]
MSCCVIIRCYNEEKHIGRLLTGLMEQTLQDVEIVVVDSGSTDATVSIASRYPVKLVTIDKADFTFGRSLNYGCAAATKDYLVIASAHVYPVYTDWLEQLLHPFAKDANVGLVYGKQRGTTTTKYSEMRIFEQWFPEEPQYRQETPFCNNANAAIPRRLWEQFPYDEQLTGLEDVAWAHNIIKQGYHLSYIPEAEIIHIHEEVFSQTYNRYHREAIAFKAIFPEAKFSSWTLLRLLSSTIFSDILHAFRDGMLLKKWLEIIYFRVAQLYGTYRGYRWHQPITRQIHRRFYYPNLKREETHVSEERQQLRIAYQSTPPEQQALD